MNLTSSILLRLNISNFWYNKIFIFNNYTKILKLVFNILYYFKNWLCLNNFFFVFYKYLIFKNNIYLISYFTTFLLFNIWEPKILLKKRSNNLILLHIYLYFIYNFLISFYFIFKKNIDLNIYLYLKYLYFFLFCILIYYNKKKYINKKKHSILKLIILMNLKIQKYIFEFNIYKFFNVNLALFLRNVATANNFFLFDEINVVFLQELLEKNTYYFLKDLIFIFIISSLYGIKDLFNSFILWNLNITEKTHYFFLNNLLKILIELYKCRISFSKGFLCIVKGKINGIERKRTFKINLGSFGLQNFNKNIIYSSTYHITRFGILGIKSWFIL